MNIKQRGFTLLLAALIASIMLSLASAIFSIATKQNTLASLSQQSQYAFYAADSGAECALYWDIHPQPIGYFATTTPNLTPTCDGYTLFNTAPWPSGNSAQYSSPSSGPEYTTSFNLQLNNGPLNNGPMLTYCAIVTVIKCQGALLDTGICCQYGVATDGSCNPSGNQITTISTQIRSNGFNTSCATIATGQNVLERSVELNY